MRLQAPAGAYAFFHEGETIDIPEHGLVDVPDHIGHQMLTRGGFTRPVEAIAAGDGDLVTVPRAALLEMLSLLGVGVPGGMTDEALVQALRAAVRDLAGAPAEGDSPQEQDAEDDVEDEEEPAEQASPAAQDPPPAPQQAPQPTPQPQQQPSVRSRVRR